MAMEFCSPRPEITPTIYADELVDVASHKGYLKGGKQHVEGTHRRIKSNRL